MKRTFENMMDTFSDWTESEELSYTYEDSDESEDWEEFEMEELEEAVIRIIVINYLA